jgi:hypothetical protein
MLRGFEHLELFKTTRFLSRRWISAALQPTFGAIREKSFSPGNSHAPRAPGVCDEFACSSLHFGSRN